MNGNVVATDNKYSVEWYTPAHILKMLTKIIGNEPTLDPCSKATVNKNLIKAKNYIDLAEGKDGLLEDWTTYLKDPYQHVSLMLGQRIYEYVLVHEWVWCNPPFGAKNIEAWFDKIIKSNLPTVLLIPSNVDTSYFQKILTHKNTNSMMLLNRRIQFVDENGNTKGNSNTKGTVLFFINFTYTEKYVSIVNCPTKEDLVGELQGDELNHLSDMILLHSSVVKYDSTKAILK